MRGFRNKFTVENLLYYLAVFFTLTTVWLLWPDTIEEFVSDGLAANEKRIPDYYMYGLRYVAVRETKREMEMFAEWASFDLEKQEMLGNAVKANLYNEVGEFTKVTGDKGRFQTDKQLLYLTGNVFSESADGFVMTGEEAELDSAKKFLVSPTAVAGHSKEEDIEIWGDRGDSDFNKNISHLYGNAIVHHTDEKRKLTKIRGDEATIQRTIRQVDFTGNIFVDQDDLTLKSKFATLFYAQGSKRPVKYMIAREDVETHQANGRETRSQVAEFFTPTNTVVLTVFPALYDKGDMVTGDKITLYRSTGVVEVTQANAALMEVEERKQQKKNSSKDDKTKEASEQDDESELAP